MKTCVITQTIYLPDDSDGDDEPQCITFALDTCRDEKDMLTITVAINGHEIEFPYNDLINVVTEFNDAIQGMGA